MQAESLREILQPAIKLLYQSLPKELASSVTTEVESMIKQSFAEMALIPKREFEALEALLGTLEAQVTDLEARLAKLESEESAKVDKRE